MAGIYNIPAITRGDTFASRVIAGSVLADGDPVVILSARMQIRTKRDKTLIYEWNTEDGNAEITGGSLNNVTIDEVADTVTELWPAGIHEYDLEIITQDFGKITLLAGSVPVPADVTHD